MKGTIVERPKGSHNYAIRFSAGLDHTTGKYRQMWESGFKTITDARKRLTELEHQRNTGKLVRPGKTTVADYLRRWLQDYAKGNLSPKTTQGYESIIEMHIIPALGKITLTQLKPEEIQRYYSEKLSNGQCDGSGALTSTTVSHHHTCLHRALKMAVKWNLIDHNPCDAVIPPRPQHTEMHTMNEDEVKLFLSAARSTSYYCLFYVSLFTGARRGELLALRWSDVDLFEAQIHITRSVLQLRDRSLIYKAPKTSKGRRMISLSPSTALILRRHKQEREACCATLIIPFEPDSLVFCQLDGSSLLPDSVTQAWTRLIRKTGLKHFRLHDARHTHASLLLKQGVHPKIVQERLGHATISTTLDLYSHVAPGLQEAAAAKLDDILANEPAKINL
jgi:integrase